MTLPAVPSCALSHGGTCSCSLLSAQHGVTFLRQSANFILHIWKWSYGTTSTPCDSVASRSSRYFLGDTVHQQRRCRGGGILPLCVFAAQQPALACLGFAIIVIMVSGALLQAMPLLATFRVDSCPGDVLRRRKGRSCVLCSRSGSCAHILWNLQERSRRDTSAVSTKTMSSGLPAAPHRLGDTAAIWQRNERQRSTVQCPRAASPPL